MLVTIALDSYTWSAVGDLAHQYDCSASEAISRAVLSHHKTILGLSDARCRERVRHLEHLFELFEGNDAVKEIRMLKEQNEGF